MDRPLIEPPYKTGVEPSGQRDAERLAMALQAGRMGTWTYHIAEQRIEASEIGREIFGLKPHEQLSPAELAARIHPEDRERREVAMRAAVEAGAAIDVEYRICRPDGGISWVMLRGHAEYGGDGAPLRLNGVSLDITERKENEARLRLLLDELNHRVKNTLATVQSIAVQTRRASRTADDFSKSLVSRIEALARAHDLLTDRAWDGAMLHEVVGLTMAPYAMLDSRRISSSGPNVKLSPNAAVTLNMAFHELATNAAKYGALSNENGRVDVSWAVDSAARPALILIRWAESGGPPVHKPDHRGFGSRLIEQSLTRELAGDIRLDFAAHGVSCEMRLQVTAKIAPIG